MDEYIAKKNPPDRYQTGFFLKVKYRLAIRNTIAVGVRRVERDL